jgi:hypothetical protein
LFIIQYWLLFVGCYWFSEDSHTPEKQRKLEMFGCTANGDDHQYQLGQAGHEEQGLEHKGDTFQVKFE